MESLKHAISFIGRAVLAARPVPFQGKQVGLWRLGFLVIFGGMRLCYLCLCLCVTLGVSAAERRFDFSQLNDGAVPKGFRAALNGSGVPPDWKIVLDEVPSAMQAMTPEGQAMTKRPVLAQLSQDPTDERFPLFIFEEDIFTDFTLTTRFKLVSGKVEQMAGLIFRAQNESNYYVLRASGIGSTFRFYKVVDGVRSSPIGPSLAIPTGVWHEMSVTCEGNRIRCSLNGKELIPELNDYTFISGKIGLWTKSDSVSYFADTRINYVPREPALQKIVNQTLSKYPKLLGLRIYVPGKEPGTTEVFASGDLREIGRPGGDAEFKAISQEKIFHEKQSDAMTVIMPLRDRNGDVIAAGRVTMTTFKGQTGQNAVVRAAPIVKEVESRIRSLERLLE